MDRQHFDIGEEVIYAGKHYYYSGFLEVFNMHSLSHGKNLSESMRTYAYNSEVILPADNKKLAQKILERYDD